MDSRETEMLLCKYGNLIYTVVISVLGHRRKEDTEECVFDVLYELSKSEFSFSDIGKNLVITVARRRAIDRLRKIKPREYTVLEKDFAEFDVVEDKVIDMLNAEIVRRVLSGLEDTDKDIFVRRFYYCQSIKEIALAFNFKPKYVENRIYHIKKELREKLIDAGVNL